MSMKLDPIFQALFAQMPNLKMFDLWRDAPEKAREEFKRLCKFGEPTGQAIGKTEDVKIPGPHGDIGLRIYTPVAAGGAALPCIVFFHGGGFVVGDLDCYDALCRTLANESSCRVISVDYRLAPEHAFPTAVEDCFAALKYVEANAPTLGIDANRLAVAGDSAGGNLAAVCCLLAKEAGGPNIDFQLLIYPVTRIQSDQGAANGLNWIYAHYVPAGADLSDVRLSPLAAKNLSGLPPAYVVTAGFDPLREEGRLYAEKLKAAGVAVAHVDYPTMVHGFFSMQGLIPMAPQAVAAAAQAVKEALN